MDTVFALYFVVALAALALFLTQFDLRSELMFALAFVAAAIWPLAIPLWLLTREGR